MFSCRKNLKVRCNWYDSTSNQKNYACCLISFSNKNINEWD